MNGGIRGILQKAYEPTLADELVKAYVEAKHQYHLGVHRLSVVESGRFCEAAYRILEHRAKGNFTPLSQQADQPKITKDLEKLSPAQHEKSVRVSIPRALRVAYDIRNGRNAAHLSDITLSLQDATLAISAIDWVLAEFIRLSGVPSPEETQALVEDLVTKRVPIVQEFDGVPKVLRADLRAGDYALVLLYHMGTKGVTVPELSGWVPKAMRTNLRRTLRTLEGKALVHQDAQRVLITFAGQRLVEDKGLLDPR
ncbi:hypothetical protein [Streptomyces klenkii]|uniref:hypothetical protein n=1 Tax=Streptomyces klenkii TaxID=1420899 RepID=UPI00342126F7